MGVHYVFIIIGTPTSLMILYSMYPAHVCIVIDDFVTDCLIIIIVYS